MKAMQSLIFAAGIVALAAAAGCNKEKVPSCSKAVGNFYDKNCVIAESGTPLSRGEAIAGCEDSKTLAKSCSCPKIYDDALKCINGVGMNECYSCQSQFDNFNGCLAGCL